MGGQIRHANPAFDQSAGPAARPFRREANDAVFFQNLECGAQCLAVRFAALDPDGAYAVQQFTDEKVAPVRIGGEHGDCRSSEHEWW